MQPHHELTAGSTDRQFRRSLHDAASELSADSIDRQFRQSLQDAASGLPDSSEAAKRVLYSMVRECADDLGLEATAVKYLLARPRAHLQYEAIAQIAGHWRERLERLPPRTEGKPRIILTLTEGQAIRAHLMTDVCRKLASWCELCILSSYDVESEVRTLGGNAHFFPVPPIRRSRFDRLVMHIGYLHTASPTNKRMAERLDESLQNALKQGGDIGFVLSIWESARQLASLANYVKAYNWSLKFFARTYALDECADLLSRLEGDVIFNTSTVSPASRLWTRTAALCDMPIVTNVISWDNMSTKTSLDEFADAFLLWSEEMEEDFAGTVPFLRERPCTIVGSAQFEPIIQRRGLIPREAFFDRFGLDPTKKLILYTTGSASIFPREQECLDTLLSHWRENLRGRANIMVRMHPKDNQGRYKEVQRKFPDVPFTLAGNSLADEEEWLPVREDIDLLVNQLHHCDVIVNVASTMTLEGFTIDKPAINIGFTLGESASLRYPMDDYYSSRHYSDIVGSGAARFVKDYDELFAAIEDIVDRGQYDVETQRRILRRKCLYTEDASDRISAFLQQFVAERASRGRALARPRRSPAASTQDQSFTDHHDVAAAVPRRSRRLSGLGRLSALARPVLKHVRRITKQVRRWHKRRRRIVRSS